MNSRWGMVPIEGYLDLNLLLNGAMDGFLLVLTGQLLNYPVHGKRIAGGVLIGAVPVVLAVFPSSLWTELSKFVTPAAMVGVSFPWTGWKNFAKAFVGFFLLSAGLGGLVYALWGWAQWDGSYAGRNLQIVLGNLWLLPVAAVLWWGGQQAWYRWQKRRLVTDEILCDLEIDFGAEGKCLQVKALLDTGNQLRDPITQKPVILLEEEAAKAALPPQIQALLETAWRDVPDPWAWLAEKEPELLRQVVPIPMQTVERQSWILGIRPKAVRRLGKTDEEKDVFSATVGLVPQTLSREGEYRALLHADLHHAG